MKYSIHRCLAELKVLDSRINKAINSGVYIGFKKKSAKGDYSTNLQLDEFEKTCISNLDSVKALIKRRNDIKLAVVNSNANTNIEIGGKTYTVASAIERKESISYEKSFLNTLVNQYNKVINTINSNNDRVEMQLEQKINAMLGGENVAKNIDMVTTFSDKYREDNGYEIIDPLKLKQKIDELDKEISEFETEVDFKLSTSNAITEVEIEE